MNSLSEAYAPEDAQRTQAKIRMEDEITSKGFDAGLAVEVLRELFDDIEPADRTEMAKRMHSDDAVTLDEFREFIYGSEEHPKYTAALYDVINDLTSAIQSPEERREVFTHLNYALDDLMEDIRDNSPHVVTHNDGTPIDDIKNDSNGDADLEM